MLRHLAPICLLLALSGCADDAVDMDTETTDMATDVDHSDIGSDMDMPPVDVIRTRGAGTVVGSDTELRFLTLDHDAIPDIQMGAMTMPFDIADGVDIDMLEEGDRVSFDLEASEETGLLITRLCRPDADGEDCLDG